MAAVLLNSEVARTICSALKTPLACALLAGSGLLAGVPAAHAEPLTPLTPAELAFLHEARSVLPTSGDPVAFNSDGELLDQGRMACYLRDTGTRVGFGTTLISNIISGLAFEYLCPQ